MLEENRHWYLVDGEGLASTHILKPEPQRTRLQGMTSNELACMRLAMAVGVANYHLAKVMSDNVIEKLCAKLNATEIRFPRTNLRMVFKVGSS